MTIGLLCFFAGGFSGATLTGARSEAVTFCPAGGVPDAVATLSKERGTFGREHVYVTAAPGASDASAGSCAEVRLQFGVSGSLTTTFVSVTLPVFVTVIVNLAVPPAAIDCAFGFFTIVIPGSASGVTFSGSHAAVRGG